MHPIVLGMCRIEDTNIYVVFSDDGISEKFTELHRFDNEDDGKFFMKTHPLPIGNIDKWIWDIKE